MFKALCSNTFTSVFTQSLTHQSKFFFRRRHQLQPLMRFRSFKSVSPAPGDNLELPDWTPETYLLKIGSGCSEYADKFETLGEIFQLSKDEMKEKGVPPIQRKQILRIRNLLKRGVITFEYLERRKVYTLPDKKTKK